MKKIYIIITILLSLLLMPSNIEAREINKYYMDIVILEDGSMHVKELVAFQGEFSGYYFEIGGFNQTLPTFDDSKESFFNNDFYNGSGIELIAVKELNNSNDLNFNSINNDGVDFVRKENPNLGDYGVYNQVGDRYYIYNPSNGEQKLFYIEYIISDVVVVHNDVSEVYSNIFFDTFETYIKELEIHVNTSVKDQNIRAWVHGPITGELDINDGELIIKNKNIDAYQPMDFRIVFNNSVSPGAIKRTNLDGLDMILEVEQELAEQANAIRNSARLVSGIYYALVISWFIGLIYIINHMYHKYDKERLSTFKTKYFRDFPGNYGPEIVSYLFHQSISLNSLSASLTNMIAEKIISFEETSKKSFTLTYNGNAKTVSEAEKFLLNWFFNEIGTDGKVNIEEINKEAKKNYDKFLNNHRLWINLATKEAKDLNFFESNNKPKAKAAIYATLGFFGAILIQQTWGVSLVVILLYIASGISFIYFLSITKRTQDGNEQYRRWLGLKRFLKDFGRFKTRDLPNIVLWEKYLVYAMVFGLSKKLAKTMKIRFSELGDNNINQLNSINNINRMIIINNSVSHGVNRAISSASSSRAAASRDSSGSGFGGGGFSSGGGFGGGSHGGGGF